MKAYLFLFVPFIGCVWFGREKAKTCKKKYNPGEDFLTPEGDYVLKAVLFQIFFFLYFPLMMMTFTNYLNS